ncbi:MAG TPA: DUF3710 domain-containing protein [Candidatus Nesterenkonia stercoripullorum]|uniref:DUF3710 domain-containing protein n=1 Tax=Candidatus Nesterenkonia stercoripullorum TaxID=2838701 RepID=A0A9D1S014_9MICC|nr:DUF3710 domain-containing protein [Candidatus Nesterenkonia stercoripullorum]
MVFGKKKKARADAAGAEADGTSAGGTPIGGVEVDNAAAQGRAAQGSTAQGSTAQAEAVEGRAAEGKAAGSSDAKGAAEGAASADEATSDGRAAATAETATAETVAAVAAASADAPSGTPRDVAELSSTKGFLDFGGLLIPASPQQKVRLDIDQKTKRVVALTITLGQASIQLQPFSAPKSGGTWEEVRQQIADSVKTQKGRIKEVDGRFGRELAARVPTTLKDGRQGWRVARFIGFEGPRWFLRGVVGGRGAIDSAAAREVEDFFASVVVVRGEDPLPPRELLPLRPPEGAKRVSVPRNPAQRRDAGNGPNPGAAALDSTSEGQS